MAQPVAVEDVVTKDERTGLPGNETLPNDEHLRKAVLAFLDALFRGPQCQAAVRIWGNPKKAPFLEEMEMK